MPPRLRLVSLSQAPAWSPDELLARLSSHGPHLLVDDEQPCDATIVSVAEVDEAALARVGELARRGGELLAILPRGCDVERRIALFEHGASDVLAADAAPEAIAARVGRWLAVSRLVRSSLVERNLVGGCASWRRALRGIVEVAHFTGASVLLDGESGTGKELVARLIHTLDPRPDKGELVVLDCTTIVSSLAGSEFFGHERGAYTGATSPREGAFELANGGTLFLDEIGELPLSLQAQLLRAIQEHTYKRVGSNAWHRTEFRLVCATHRDLAAAVARGEFRHDLYHRIATWRFHLPALRERRDDVLTLARHFVASMVEGAAPELDEAVERYLLAREYPGNIRELRHTVQRLVDRHPGVGPITLGQIPLDERRVVAAADAWCGDGLEAIIGRGLAMGVGLRGLRKQIEDVAIRLALGREHGSIARASRRLGLTERALQLREAERRRSGTDHGDDAKNDASEIRCER